MSRLNIIFKQAKTAYRKAITAVEEDDEEKKHNAWREIFGRQFQIRTSCS